MKAAKSGDPISRVKCVVNSCLYWNSGNQCLASMIEIEPPNATDSRTTDCATFAPK